MVSSNEGMNTWIIDSGATCHMCNDVSLFVELLKFDEDGCHIFDENQKPIATAIRVGNLYYLNCARAHKANATSEDPKQESKEVIWHKRYGHLGVQNLQKLAMTKISTSVNLVLTKSIIEANSQ